MKRNLGSINWKLKYQNCNTTINLLSKQIKNIHVYPQVLRKINKKIRLFVFPAKKGF